MKILVADDDRDLRDLVGFTLTQAGYLVIKAPDGTAAIRAVADEAPVGFALARTDAGDHQSRQEAVRHRE